MHYFVDMYDEKLNFIENISDETCRAVLEASGAAEEVLNFYALGKCVWDAWSQLISWSNETNTSGNHIMRNIHMAERLVRGFLFEFRTCLDHMETDIKRKYGEDSELWRIFKRGTSNAYDCCPEYAFTSHLRNCAQHCKNVVHGFNGVTGVGISSNTDRLRTEYKKWKQVDIDFMGDAGKEIDLLEVFSKTVSAFQAALKPVVQYLLDTDNVCGKLLYLREWGDLLQNEFKHDVHCFHIVNLVFRDGTDAAQENMATDDVMVKAHLLNWEMIYELTDALAKRELSD